ncbi:MAG: hypothetical protein IJD49_04145 [Clostridia bacterium]|nr:hypothetical protein [Clostridia bacterium]
MKTEIIVSLITLAGSALGTFAGIIVNSKLTSYRIEQLEKKVDKHNNVIERTTELEAWKENINLEIKEIKGTINTLLNFHMKG